MLFPSGIERAASRLRLPHAEDLGVGSIAMSARSSKVSWAVVTLNTASPLAAVAPDASP
jgi:hypothetical protein